MENLMIVIVACVTLITALKLIIFIIRITKNKLQIELDLAKNVLESEKEMKASIFLTRVHADVDDISISSENKVGRIKRHIESYYENIKS